jgi:Cu/Ag efflux pump CusA
MILGFVTIFRTPTDIFPNVDIPVIAVVFNYAGMSADDMESRIVTQFERFMVTTVNDIDDVESQSLNGVGVMKVFFQKNARIEEATAQVTATAQTSLRQMPPGTQPPLIIRYSASGVPILQLSIHSDTIPEQQLFDVTINPLRTQAATEALEQARNAFQNNLAINLDVLAAQDQQLNAQLQLTGAKFDGAVFYLDLVRATGRRLHEVGAMRPVDR